jgi:hypothetical protein
MLQSAEMQTVLVHPMRNIEISKLKKRERGRGETYIYLPSWQVTSTSRVRSIKLQLNKESASFKISELHVKLALLTLQQKRSDGEKKAQ